VVHLGSLVEASSHAVSHEVEGLSRFDGTLYQYFHDLPRGRHTAWDSRGGSRSRGAQAGYAPQVGAEQRTGRAKGSPKPWE
jgi:hypothetical protein